MLLAILLSYFIGKTTAGNRQLARQLRHGTIVSLVLSVDLGLESVVRYCLVKSLLMTW